MIFSCTLPPSNSPFASVLARPILALGEPAFGDALLAAAGDAIQADLVSAFCIDDAGRPHYRFATAVPALGNTFAQSAGARYESDYWNSDPGLNHLLHARQERHSTVVCQQAWDQIPHAWYRAVCYERPRLVDRISVLGEVNGRLLLLSAYRRAVNGPFAPDELRQFVEHADALVALVSKHLDLAESVNRGGAAHSIEERLALRFPELSARERQVCVGVVSGMTAKDIARTYGIETSSVVTYKKRALDKLGVPNQRALVARWHATESPLS